MAGIMSLLQKLGFTSGADDEMNADERYESDVEEEDEEDEDEEDSRSGFGFPFSFSIFGKGRGQDEDEDEDEEDDEEEADESDEEEAPPAAQSRQQARSSRVIDYKKTKAKKYDMPVQEHHAKHCEHIIVVRQLSDSRTIITHLHHGDSVILNLENIDPKDCGRVIDLLSGAAFALGGSIIKVSRLTYLLAPDTVNVIPPQNTPAANRYSL